MYNNDRKYIEGLVGDVTCIWLPSLPLRDCDRVINLAGRVLSKLYISNSCNMPQYQQCLPILPRITAHTFPVAKKSQISFCLLKSSKNPPFHYQQLPSVNLVMSLRKCTYVRSYEFCKTSFIQTYYALHSCVTHQEVMTPNRETIF